MIAEVFLGLALICFNGECHPILYGDTTPTGQYDLVLRITQQPGYGGDVLQFKQEDDSSIYAIHRVYTLDRKRDRFAIIRSPNANKKVTNGCINIETSVYDKLKKCCNKVLIRK